MDRREIEVFVTVMQLGSVSGAARALNMAQPSVSKAIALIERRHGMALFERRRGRLVATGAAQQLVGEATRIYEELARFDRQIDAIRQLRPNVVRVASTPSLSLSLLPLIVSRHRKMMRSQGFILDMHPNHDIAAAVARRQYDIGLMVHAGAEPPPDTLTIRRGRIVCVFQEADPLARFAEVSPAQLENRDLIAITTDLGIVSMLAGNVPVFNSRFARGFETNRYNIAINLVRQGLGVTLVDEFTMFGQEGRGLCWRPLSPALEVSLLVALPDIRSLRPEVAQILDIIKAVPFPGSDLTPAAENG
ncbi:LysR family transcriptional regulator [Pseudogemmobacter bohemicus]|uniref:LysR family transcriptional regulator n=1 Tax=Pseudogemmobacter bohemicus TaxID=2250708 RepID=UPI0018E4F822|nr:LysR family transcriptional regulator [Pseudogemmobacter bohemicus]